MAQNGEKVEIVEVWSSNFESVMKEIIRHREEISYISLDTEFPGKVFNPETRFFNPDQDYTYLKMNIDVMKVIQIGLGFADKNGNVLMYSTDEGVTKQQVFQFNLSGFDRRDDPYSKSSIELLEKSGIDFDRIIEQGIDPDKFIGRLLPTNIFTTASRTWIVFHGEYDIGLIFKLIARSSQLPERDIFLDRLKVFFPKIFDLKVICNRIKLYGGLEAISKRVGVERSGHSHLAGSDSLLTLDTFFKIREVYHQEDEPTGIFGII